MKITKNNLDKAVNEGILDKQQADALYTFLKSQPDSGPAFNFTNILYYFGGLIAIGAMTLFMNLGWEQFGGWGMMFIALLYAGIGLLLTERFQRGGHAIPAGICATFVIAMTPLGIYGLQQGMGWWPDDTLYQEYYHYIKWHWIYLELGTLAIGIIMAWRYRYPFMIMPVAVTLWYMSMDVAAMLTGGEADYRFRAFVSMWFGLVITLLAFWVDIRSRKSEHDYAFWLYLFGVMAFWCGLSLQYSDSELAKFLYFCINLGLIGVGAILVRRVFVVFGALGCAGYLEHLASSIFQDSWLFPIALTAIGLGIVYLGIIWQRNEALITQKTRGLLPVALQELLAERTL
ncbi:MAG: DUF2157 domain-containing protein [Pseudomonadota bacterium]